MREESIDEQIKGLIRQLIKRVSEASPRDAHALACAVKELYNCREAARSDVENDWRAQLADTEIEADFGLEPETTKYDSDD